MTAWAASVNAWAAERPGNYGVDFKAEQHETSVLHVQLAAKVMEAPPLKDWSLEVGDVLSNLRSALDYAVRELAVVGTGSSPPPGERKLQFPIFDDERGYRKVEEVWLRGVPESARAVVESFQVFRQEFGPTEIPWLCAFREVHNESKHRRLLDLSGALDATTIRLDGTIMPKTLDAKYLGKSLEHGDLLAEFDLNLAAGIPRNLSVSASIDPYLVFHFTAPGEGGALAGQEVGLALGGFIGGVEAVLDALEASMGETTKALS